jgi:hypothetical protein
MSNIMIVGNTQATELLILAHEERSLKVCCHNLGRN